MRKFWTTISCLVLTAAIAFGQGVQVSQVRTAPDADTTVMTVAMRLTFDSVRVGSNRVRAYFPVIADDEGHSRALRAVLLTGRRQHYVIERNADDPLASLHVMPLSGRRGTSMAGRYPDAIEVWQRKGRATWVDYSDDVVCEPWMRRAELRLVADSCGCGLVLGEGVGSQVVGQLFDEPYDAVPLCRYAFVRPQSVADPVLSLSGRSYLDFPVNRIEIHPDYRRNPAELRKIIATIDTVRHNPHVELVGIRIHGYASPEGSYAHNAELAQGRADALKGYVMRLYSFDPSLIDVESTPEDWDGLVAWLSDDPIAAALAHRDDLLSIARSDAEPDQRDQHMRRTCPQDYAYILREVYPALRHSDYEIDYRIRPMSLDEAREVYRTQPELLSVARLYDIAATYAEGSAERNEVYETAARLYPDDPVACLNAAQLALGRRDADTARRLLLHAGPSPEAENARGILALLDGDPAEAARHFRRSGIAEAEANLKAMDPLLK